MRLQTRTVFMLPTAFSRRRWLEVAGASVVLAAQTRPASATAARPKVAAIFTEFRLRSHAFHILTSLMGPYLFRGQWIDPGVDIVSFYADQSPEGDMTRG